MAVLLGHNFQIYGPCGIFVSVVEAQPDTAAPTSLVAYTEIGRTDNDDLFKFEEEHQTKEIYSSSDGAMPADFVYTGTIAKLSFSLAKWNHAIVEEIQSRATGTGEMGSAGVIGRTMMNKILSDGDLSGDNGVFQLIISPDTHPQYSYWFKACLMTDPVEHVDFGNTNRRVIMRARVVRSVADDGTMDTVLFEKIDLT